MKPGLLCELAAMRHWSGTNLHYRRAMGLGI